MPKSIFYIIFLILVINNVIISGWVVPTLNPHHPKKTDLVKNLLTYSFWILSIYIPLQRPSVQNPFESLFLNVQWVQTLEGHIAYCNRTIKSVFSEIKVRTWVQVVSRQKNKPLIGRPNRSPNQRHVCLAGKLYLNSCPDFDLRKKQL